MNEISERFSLEMLNRFIWSRKTYHCRRKARFTVALILSVLLLVMCIPEQCWGKIGTGSDEDISLNAGDSVEDDPDNPDSFEVRFVTEDDFLYEDERSQNQDFHQGARSGGRSQLIHQYERCPPLPDPAAVASSGLCEAKRCQRDDECSKHGSVICCYNGCVYSCLPKVNLPLAFDWVEETDLKYMSNEQERLNTRAGAVPSPRSLLNAEISPEMVSLPGGCYLSTKQYEDLNLFRKFEHIKSCSCNKGEVFCEIKHEEKEPGKA